ncbi:MAG: molybdopterin cofactor-binding domain-containing protein, partial [Oscillospiraceae bacterium]|nr:molybdopterin cofactor-binding domain-containing protein [Oscillospiraceae bacterium]
MKQQSSLLGQSVPRVDAYDKVTGRSKFTADLFPPNCLVAKVLHATIANGLVKRIDTAKASALPGVVKIVTCFEVPDLPFATSGNPWTLDPAWQDIADRKLLNQRVRYYGDDIAAVVAVDESTARQALRLIQVEYEEYPAVFTPQEAIQPGAVPVHAECPDNIMGSNHREEGDYNAAIREPGLICIDKWYHVPPVKHCHMENPVSYAYMRHQRLVVVASTQMVHVLRRVIAQALGLPWGQVQVIKP